MARRGQAKPRKVDPDPIYKNRVVTKFINRAMKDGKKSAARNQVYKAFEMIKKEGKDPLKVFTDAINNVKPDMEVRPRRVGGAAYQVPMPVRGSRKESLAIRWLIQAARSRSNTEYHSFSEKLKAELTDAANGEGVAMKRRTDTERMAEANRAFAHFRW